MNLRLLCGNLWYCSISKTASFLTLQNTASSSAFERFEPSNSCNSSEIGHRLYEKRLKVDCFFDFSTFLVSIRSVFGMNNFICFFPEAYWTSIFFVKRVSHFIQLNPLNTFYSINILAKPQIRV